jgi:peptide deformylase
MSTFSFFSDIRTEGDPVLRQVSKPVAEVDSKTNQLINTLHARLDAHSSPGVGLAATQVGILQRVFVYDLAHYGHWLGRGSAINPEITDSEGDIVVDEGCLSIPGLWLPVPRKKHVEITVLREDGLASFELNGTAAQLFQHEIDHFNGVLMTDHIGKEDLRRIRREQSSEPRTRRRTFRT